MLALELKFVTGKYHATPWGRQVNEGAVEWPPSPWRILRTLIATWYHKFPDVPESEIRALIEALSSPPSYQLPPTLDGHTRHFMPVADNEKRKIFDTFVAVNPNDRLVICWPKANPSPEQISLLTQLARSINYFGRAESWVEAEVTDVANLICDTVPLDENGVAEDQELVRLLGLTDSNSFVRWREAATQALALQRLKEEQGKAIAKGKPADKIKLTPKMISAIESSIPQATFEALQCDTSELRKAGWNRPPGSEWASYVRTWKKASATKRYIKSKDSFPRVARYAVAGNVLPRLTDAILLGERLRSYLMGISGKRNDGQCSMVFSGKSHDGKPLAEHCTHHGHAHFLCESYGSNNLGRITHVMVYAPAGFDLEDQSVLTSLRGIYGNDGHDLQLILLGIGMPSDFGGTNVKIGQSPTLAESRVWVSRTPIVPTDHLRIRRSERRDPEAFATATKRELDRLVRRELVRRPWLAHLADQVQIEALDHTLLGGIETKWLKFRRQRTKGGGECSSNNGFGFRLTFPEPIIGPIALGYGSHYGLGLFEAEPNY